jgi:hypothetical protein
MRKRPCCNIYLCCILLCFHISGVLLVCAAGVILLTGNFVPGYFVYWNSAAINLLLVLLLLQFLSVAA